MMPFVMDNAKKGILNGRVAADFLELSNELTSIFSVTTDTRYRVVSLHTFDFHILKEGYKYYFEYLIQKD